MVGKRMRPVETMNNWHGNKGVVTVTPGVPTSGRCRATHDVPYSLRCILDASHAWVPAYVRGGIGAFMQHMDKKGGTWDV
jgi:hypothetical protein